MPAIEADTLSQNESCMHLTKSAVGLAADMYKRGAGGEQFRG